MPELPDVPVYVEHLERRVRGAVLERLRVASPNLLRTFDPPCDAAHGRRVVAVRRLGKRIVLALEGDLFLALHLMIAGRLHWRDHGAPLAKRVGLAAFDFADVTGVGGEASSATLVLTENSTKQRAGLHVLRGEAAVAALAAGGIEPLAASATQFAGALKRENHTLK